MRKARNSDGTDRILTLEEIDAIDAERAAANAAAAIITKADVDAERDRRLSMPLDFAGAQFDFSEASQVRISGAATLAGFAVAGGALAGDYRWHGGAADFGWIAEDNSVVLMDAQTMFALGQAAANREAEIIFAARALKDQSPIPTTYTDDVHWPSVT